TRRLTSCGKALRSCLLLPTQRTGFGCVSLRLAFAICSGLYLEYACSGIDASPFCCLDAKARQQSVSPEPQDPKLHPRREVRIGPPRAVPLRPTRAAAAI